MEPPRPTLEKIAPGIYAYLQPTVGWSRNNAGLIAGAEFAVVVDTLFDLPLTRAMLEAFGRVNDKPVRYLVNTHSNADHVHGNQLVEGAAIVAQRNCRAEMMRGPGPESFEALVRGGTPGRDLSYIRESFGEFDFRGLRRCPPTITFDERLELFVDDRELDILHFGPAHTAGDAVVHIPGARVLFAGDLLFYKDAPVVWAGSLPNWIAALDKMAALDVETIVPGHGPLCGREGLSELREYFVTVREQSEAFARAGLSADDAARQIDLGRFASWTLPERLIAIVERCYRECGAIPPDAPLDALELLARMGRLRDERFTAAPRPRPA